MKRILIFIDWYLPAYKAGGPVRSIVNLVEALKTDFLIDIVTSDRDFGDSLPFESIEKNVWIQDHSNVRIIYLSPENHLRKIIQILKSKNYDKIYLNSFFSFKFSFLPLLICYFNRRHIVLAPRGMLGKGALELKRSKKRLFITIYKMLLLDKKITWHVTSEQEMNEIVNIFGKSSISLIPNLATNNNSSILRIEKQPNYVKLCFISRISEKKNLEWGIKAIIDFGTLNTDANIELDIYGPIEDSSYWDKCLLIINNNQNKKIRINYCGELFSHEVGVIISKYHFLFLPTKNENYGHIIVESFLVGRPVLISDQTPWRNLKTHGAGIDFPIDNSDILMKELILVLKMDTMKFILLIESTCNYFNSKNNRSEMVKQYNYLFSK